MTGLARLPLDIAEHLRILRVYELGLQASWQSVADNNARDRPTDRQLSCLPMMIIARGSQDLPLVSSEPVSVTRSLLNRLKWTRKVSPRLLLSLQTCFRSCLCKIAARVLSSSSFFENFRNQTFQLQGEFVCLFHTSELLIVQKEALRLLGARRIAEAMGRCS